MYLATPSKGGGLYVVERAGRIRVVRRGKRLRRPFLDIARDVITAEQRGLLSVAFAPDYARSGLFYVVYTANDDTVRLDEFRRSGDRNRADPASRRPVLNIGRAGPYHHGGQLQFGPDGLLYVSTGVTDVPPLAQDLGDLHGKLLRIDPRAAAGCPTRSRPATRSPPRPARARRSGPTACATRGASRSTASRATCCSATSARRRPRRSTSSATTPPGRELRLRPARGRPPDAARRAAGGYVAPAIVRRHEAKRTACAVIGGYVVRDRRLRGLYGRYLYGDLCSPYLRSAIVGTGKARGDRRLKLRIPTVVSFGEDSRGRLYAVGIDGAVYRLVRRA